MKGLKDATDDLRFRIAELQNRPKAIAELLNSLNLSTVFLKQVEKMPEASEIYTDRDLKDLQNVNEEAMVSSNFYFTLFYLTDFVSDPKVRD